MSVYFRHLAPLTAFILVSLTSPSAAATILINFSGQTSMTMTEDGAPTDMGMATVTGSIAIDTARLPQSTVTEGEDFHYQTDNAPFLTTTVNFTGGTAPDFGGSAAVTNILRGMFGPGGFYDLDDQRFASFDPTTGDFQSSEVLLSFNGNVARQVVDEFQLPVFATGQVLALTATSQRFQSGSTPMDRSVTAQGIVTINAVTGAVPEPATWGTMVLGFGLAGAAVRRRRIRAIA